MKKTVALHSVGKKQNVDLTLNEKNSQPKFWSKILTNLQKLGKSLMFPIAILPFAALLNRFGSLAMELNPTIEGVRNAGNWAGLIMSIPGKIVFDNLALFFAIGTAFGLSKDNRGEAALVGAVLYLALSAFLMEGGLASLFYRNVLEMNYWTQDGVGNWHQVQGYSQLFYVPNFKQIDPLGTGGSLEVVGGTYILDIGVLGGIISGVMSAYLYNRFHAIKLPQALSFFGGRRFVPMMVMLTSLPLAFMFAVIWPWIQFGLVQFGQVLSSGDAWAIPGTFLYALINRFIQPFGLHHIINTFLWFQLPIVGNLVDVSGKVILGPDVLPGFDPNLISSGTEQATKWLAAMNELSSTWATKLVIDANNWSDYFVYSADKLASANGTILSMGAGQYAVFGDINAFQRGLISGNFQTGYFPMYWGGLTGAAVAMVFAAKKENRQRIIAFLGGVAVVAMLTGIDEPIVFAFIFVAPILWVYNALFTAIFAAIAISMHMHIGFGFSGGLIDYIISFASSWGMSRWEGVVNGSTFGVLSNPLWMLLLAGIMFPLYFSSFYFTIKKFNLQTPGREENIVEPSMVVKSKSGQDKYQTMAEELLKIIGDNNLVKVDNCASRLRLIVKDNKVGSDNDYKTTGAYGVRRLGDEGLQIVIGTDVEFVADALHELTGK